MRFGRHLQRLFAIVGVALAGLASASAGEMVDCARGYDTLLAEISAQRRDAISNSSVIIYGNYTFTRLGHPAHPAVFYRDPKKGVNSGCGFGDQQAYKEALEDPVKRVRCPPCQDFYGGFRFCACMKF
jgi:hypothetical protein